MANVSWDTISIFIVVKMMDTTGIKKKKKEEKSLQKSGQCN